MVLSNSDGTKIINQAHKKITHHHQSLGKCKLKPPVRYHCVSLTMTLAKLTTVSAGEDTEQLKLLYVASGNAKWYSHFGKLSDSSL